MRFGEKLDIAIQALKQDHAAGLKNLLAAYDNLLKEPLEMSSYPLIIQIEPTLHCNLECGMCVNPLSKRKKRHMALDEFRRIVDSLRFLRKISLVGAGEPLLNPAIFDMTAYAKSKDIHIGFATNGMLLNDSVCRKIVDSRLDWINISVDSANKDRYETIRKGADFGLLSGNMRRLVKAKGNKSYPEISAWFVIMQDNLSELPDVIKLSRDNGIGKVSAQLEHSWNDDSLKKKIAAAERKDFMVKIRDVLKEARRTAFESNVEFEYVNVPDNTAPRACKWPWKSCYITAEGFVTPCCLHGSDPTVINFGNILENDFYAIWNGAGYQDFRRSLVSASPPKICAGCTAYHRTLKI